MKNNNAMTKYCEFQVLGTEMEEELKVLAQQIEQNKNELNMAETNYKANPEIKYALSLFSEPVKYEKMQKILSKYENKRITFLNESNRPCVLDTWEISPNGKVIIGAHFATARNTTSWDKHPYLDKFLSISHNFNFKDLEKALHYPAETYLTQLKATLQKREEEFHKKQAAYNKKYKKDYIADLAKTDKIFAEDVKFKRKELTAEEALEQARKSKEIKEVDERYNTLLTEEQKHELLRAYADIERLYVSGLDKGQSGEALNRNYQNLSNIKYRQLKTNEEGKIVGHDQIYAHIIFKKGAKIPVDILKLLCKGQKGPELLSTYGKDKERRRLCSMPLTLYLLNEYNEFGMEANKKDLYKYIDKEGLLNTLL